MNELLEAALGYSDRGLAVFPLRPRSKAPATDHGFKDATRDLAQIERWWKHWPDRGLAIATGAESGLVVLDVDGDEGSDSLHDLEREVGPLPPCPSVESFRGSTSTSPTRAGRSRAATALWGEGST